MEMGSYGRKSAQVLQPEDEEMEQHRGSSTTDDLEDMRRLGKQQQFQRNFQLVSITAFSVITISGWVYGQSGKPSNCKRHLADSAQCPVP